MDRITLIIVAMEEELQGVLNELKDYEVIESEIGKLYSFSKSGVNYILTLGKIGKVATAFHIGKLSERYRIERIFNVGTSGALTDSINVGDVVVASSVIYSDVDLKEFNYELCQMAQAPLYFAPDDNYIIFKQIDTSDLDFKVVRGLIASGDSFVSKNNYDRLPELVKDRALCIEMESAAVAHCCYLLNIPFVIIRSISDYVLDVDNGKKMDMSMDRVCTNCAKVLLKYL